MKKIKVLVTLGPSSLYPRVIERLDELGVDIFRINLSHTRVDDLEEVISIIKQHTRKTICIDTEGAQIRSRYVENNDVYLEEGSLIEITGADIIGNSAGISVNPPFIVKDLVEGDVISMDFNNVLIQVVNSRGTCADARVIAGGRLGSNKAVTVIGRHVSLPVLTGKDKKALEISLKQGIRCFALSFASDREAVETLRKYVGSDAQIISKIETRSGLNNLDEIMEVSDAVLIDRGDLSREESVEKIPFLQKLIIQKATAADVPVYVATNLLESMVNVKKPTRAEVNDVVNTLLDGADGLVLAAETAIGQYPLECTAMISSLIRQFERTRTGYSFETLQNSSSYVLPEPHGGKLIDRIHKSSDFFRLGSYPLLEVRREIIMDMEHIALGIFSPLEGFMNQAELHSVLSDYRLPDGTIWPLPILLQVTREEADRFKEGQSIGLTMRNANNDIYGTLKIEEIYTSDLDVLAAKIFGTNNPGHPGVQLFMQRGNFFLAGPVELFKRLPGGNKKYELTPLQARAIFETKGWSKVVGFHTGNVIHQAHEAIQMTALKDHNCDGLFVHPITGLKREGDYAENVIIKSYELMLDRYYPKGKVVLGAFATYTRYAGPREAVFSALCRKNFGCSHFIVGHDHAGVKSFYGPEAAHDLFHFLGDIGIKPIFFRDYYFCMECDGYVEACRHGNSVFPISSAGARAMLADCQSPPAWHMRDDISKLIIDEIREGREVFVK